MLPQKKVFTSAAAVTFSLTYNNGELRLLVLKSELQLACFLNMDRTDTEILIFSTRIHCSNDDSWASHSTIDSRGRNNKVAAADGRCRMGSGTLTCSLRHLFWVQTFSCEAYFTNDAAQRGTKGETQCHSMPAHTQAGLDTTHCIQSYNVYWWNSKGWKIRIWTNTWIKDHSFREHLPIVHKRWDAREREIHGCWKV